MSVKEKKIGGDVPGRRDGEEGTGHTKALEDSGSSVSGGINSTTIFWMLKALRSVMSRRHKIWKFMEPTSI